MHFIELSTKPPGISSWLEHRPVHQKAAVRSPAEVHTTVLSHISAWVSSIGYSFDGQFPFDRCLQPHPSALQRSAGLAYSVPNSEDTSYFHRVF